MCSVHLHPRTAEQIGSQKVLPCLPSLSGVLASLQGLARAAPPSGASVPEPPAGPLGLGRGAVRQGPTYSQHQMLWAPLWTCRSNMVAYSAHCG